jgi:hypothetical protein
MKKMNINKLWIRTTYFRMRVKRNCTELLRRYGYGWLWILHKESNHWATGTEAWIVRAIRHVATWKQLRQDRSQYQTLDAMRSAYRFEFLVIHV